MERPAPQTSPTIYYTMDQVALVSPFTVRTDNNSSILSVLRDYHPRPNDENIRAFSVPVFKSDDIESIVSDNDRRNAKGNRADVSGSAVLDTMHDVSEDSETQAEPQKLVDLAVLEPKNRQQQMATVLFENFPVLRHVFIERILLHVVALAPAEVPKEFCWSIVTYGSTGSHSDVTNVFVRFASVETAEWIHSNSSELSSVLPGVEIACDSSLEQKTATVSESEVKLLEKEFSQIRANKNNYSIDTKRTGTEDLDEVMQHYQTYKVENSELVEVPKDLKETIVKDIIKFRSKVLTIERDRRRKEIETERRKAKLRLTQVFEGIRSAADVSSDAKDSMEVDLAEEKTDPTDELNDEEYEAFLADQRKAESEKAYQAKVAQIEALESSQKLRLLERLDTAVNYESNLIDNKFALMDEIKALLDFDPAKQATKSSHLLLYYTDHGEYIRIRNAERAREEKLDKENAEEETKPDEEELITESHQEPEKAQEDDVMEVDIVISSLSEEALSSIERKIGDLIEEYLGIREDVLIDFVFGFVKEKNLTLKEELVSELLETLDEDSKTVVDELHDYIRSLI